MTDTAAGTDARARIRAYIVDEFLGGEDAEDLTYETRLVEDGILDSISVFTLLGYLKEEFGVEFDAHEVANDMHTIDRIAELIEIKRAGGA